MVLRVKRWQAVGGRRREEGGGRREEGEGGGGGGGVLPLLREISTGNFH